MSSKERLLTPQEAAEQLGLSTGHLANLRSVGKGPAFVKLSENSGAKIRYRQGDVIAFLAERRGRLSAVYRLPDVTPKIEPMTMTCEEAALRHQGQDPRNIARMCLRGQYLAKRYGGASRVPAKEINKVLFARKVGKYWQVPVSELDRVFLGRVE